MLREAKNSIEMLAAYKAVSGKYLVEETYDGLYKGSCGTNGKWVEEFLHHNPTARVVEEGGEFVKLEVGGFYSPTIVVIEGIRFVFYH